MTHDNIDVRKLAEYNHYILKERSKGKPLRKLYYFALYQILTPIIRFVSPLVRNGIRENKPDTKSILVVGTCEADIAGTAEIWSKLKNAGYNVNYELTSRKKKIILSAFRCGAGLKVPNKLFFLSCYANQLISIYRPSVVCIFESHGPLPSLIRKQLNGLGRTVYMPHTVAANTIVYSCIDFDFYLAFGESTIVNLNTLPVRFGSTKIIKTGSPRIKVGDTLPPATNNNLLFFSNWLIGKSEGNTRDFNIVKEWAKKNSKYRLYVKFHPIEDETYVRNELSGISNIVFLDKAVGMREALSNVAAVIVSFSAASIEAAMMKRPVLIANFREKDPESADMRVSDLFLKLEDFFLPRARNAIELSDRIETLFNNYDHYLHQCSSFVSYHLENTQSSSEIIADIIISIAENKTVMHHTEMCE